MKKLIFIFVLLCLGTYSFAQIGRSIYFMEQIPLSNTVNPAYHPEHKFYVNLPVLSIYQNVELPIRLNDVLTPVAGEDSLQIDFDKLKQNLDEKNTLGFNNMIELVKMGIKVGNSYLHFGINQRMDVTTDMDKDLMLLFLEGNAGPHLLGKDISIENSGFNANLFHEAYIGYNIKLFHALTLGLRAKYLRGIGNISTEKFNVHFRTDDSTYNIHLSSDIAIRQSMEPDQLTSGLSLASLGNNSGYAFDFGLNLNFSKRFRMSLSAIDLGGIIWDHGAYISKSIHPNQEFVYDGLHFTDSTSIQPDAILDSIKGNFALRKEQKSYVSYLVPKLYLGLTFDFADFSQAGVLLHTNMNNFGEVDVKNYSLTFNYRHRILRFLTLQANYSIINQSYNNIGAGASLKLGPVMIYALTDNVMGIVNPGDYKNYNAIVGMSFLFGRIKKAEEPEEDEN